MGHIPRLPIALACFVQHNKHKRHIISQTMAGYVAESTENKLAPHYKIPFYAYA